MNPLQDAFISYGRADSKTFATKLTQRLMTAGLKVWFDFEDIPLGVDYQKQIDDGIDKADNFLFLISPHSVNSPYCRLEIERALARHKRIIPLLHVEEISWETWQQRYPNGTKTEWEEYRTEGKHSSFPNMHPEISKINWIYFREGIDDFEQGCKNLLQLCDRQKTYVHKHTVLLKQALEWQGNHKQTSYLLVGQERQQAEEWLKIRFTEQQAPCLPTDLHCEFISESIKNANNLMTQVFLAHAEQDTEVMEQIRHSLQRQGLTVWVSQTDIQTGEDFQNAINRGIEQADNIVYFLSPDAQQSAYCQHELDYAISLNKRIIPILVCPIESDRIPPSLRELQYIDLTDNVKEEDYLLDESQLLKIIQQDEAYYQEHKILLTKALKWERRHRNPSMLLRGYNLRHAEAWLKTAQVRALHPPTALQQALIAESVRQPPASSLDVFISYSRSDSDIARKLNESLQIQGKTTWFDQESIASGADFQQEINRGIEISDHFLFIMSPRSVQSPYCASEVEYAAKLSKRFVTVLYRPVEQGDLHPELAKVQWIDFNAHDKDFAANFQELIRVLDTDAEYLRMHTRILTKAIEWKDEDYDKNFLLRGKDISSAQHWLEQSATKQPPPTDLQVDFITSSLGTSNYLRGRLGNYIGKREFRYVISTSIMVTLFIFVLNLLVDLPLTFSLYDVVLRSRPSEPQDERFLLVTVDGLTRSWLREQMITQRYRPSIGEIPDEALKDTLKILDAHSPRMISLAFYRDFPSEEVLKSQLHQTPNLIGICKARYEELDGVAKAPELAVEQVGFNDFLDDDDKRTIRRQPLMQAPDPDFCDTRESLSLKMARLYLESEGVSFTSPLDEGSEGNLFYQKNGMALGETVIPQLSTQSGLYKDPERLIGYQTLLNFRTFRGDPRHFAPTLSFKEILQETFDPQLIQDRIVVILYTDDAWNTPYGDLPAGILHAQMASQLISAALDGRPLLRSWMHLQLVWMLGWSLVGGLGSWKLRRVSLLIVAGGGCVLLLYGISAISLVIGHIWVPVVFPSIGLLGTGMWVDSRISKLRLEAMLEASRKLIEKNRQ